MGAPQLAGVMTTASDYLTEQRGVAEGHLRTTLEALTLKHKVKTGTNAFLAYLEAYGFTAFEADFIQRYISLVMVTRHYSHEEFMRWVEAQVRHGRPLCPPILPTREPAAFNDAELASLAEAWLE